MKSTVDEIRARLDAAGDRFGDLDARRAATVDAPLAMAPVAEAAAATTRHARSVLDVGYRDHVLAYVEREDTPRPLVYQLGLLREAGLGPADVLKSGPFAAFRAVKAGP